MTNLIAWICFAFGAWICCFNFYVTFLKALFHRLCKLPKETYKWESPIPLLGTLFVALSLLSLHSIYLILTLGIILMILDTGGLIYLFLFLFAMASHSLDENRKK